eukprot:7384247-Prymnesium_polylepis.1
MEAQSNSTVGGDPEPKRGSESRRPINLGKLLRKRACPPLPSGVERSVGACIGASTRVCTVGRDEFEHLTARLMTRDGETVA